MTRDECISVAAGLDIRLQLRTNLRHLRNLWLQTLRPEHEAGVAHGIGTRIEQITSRNDQGRPNGPRRRLRDRLTDPHGRIEAILREAEAKVR